LNVRSSKGYRFASYLWHRLVPRSLRQQFWAAYYQIRGEYYGQSEYQKIRFRGVTYVDGRDRYRSYRQLFPSAPVGKTLLDAGACYGYYPLMAIHEGARFCRAVERNADSVAKMREVSKALAISTLDIVQADIVDYSTSDCFDIVLCLNVLHHLETIHRVQLVLETLYEATREKMVLIVASPRDLTQPYVYDDVLTEGKRLIRLSQCTLFRSTASSTCR